MRAGSVFSGLGGLDTAVHRALGASPAWMCENDPHCRTILQRHWPDIPIIPDVHEIDETVGPVDVLHGGYPCQPFSLAGHRKGKNDPRHLWPEMARLVRVLRPPLVVLENVAGHLVLGFGDVQADLAEMGYDTRWGCVRASDVGAPHRRERLFVVAADTHSTGPQQRREPDPTRREPGLRGTDAVRPPLPAADPDSEGLERIRPEPAESNGRITAHGDRTPAQPDWGIYEAAIRRWEHTLGRPAPRPTDDRGRLMAEFVEWMMGLPDGWTHGLSRAHRLRMLGNAVCPQQGEHAIRTLTTP